MTRQILLALALTVVTAAIAAPQVARACGGYAPIDPAEVAIRETVEDYTRRHIQAYARTWAYDIRHEDDRATAVLRQERGEGYVDRDVRLVRRDGRWRVVRVGPERAV